MNCFVASSFDHDDVDAVYDCAIRPVLKEFRICPLRVDRVEHNDDIDDQIFQLIGRSQVCIADLTHARPSVYYEAGYASGLGKPVVYIARSDHFRAQPDDESGNLRVHFDLQMRNIIPWTDPNEAFKKRLRSRLRVVLRPLLRQCDAEHSVADDRKRFAALSQNEKLASVVRKGQTLLYSRGFRKGPRSEIGPLRRYPHYAHLAKLNGHKYLHIHLLAFPGINKTNLEGIPFLWHHPKPTMEQGRIVHEVVSSCVIAALRASRTSSLSALLPNWTPLSEKVYQKQIDSLHDERDHTATIIFTDGIQSIEEFVERLRPSIETMTRGQQPAAGN